MTRLKDLVTPQGRLKNSRVSCHDVYDFLKNARPHTEIAASLLISPEEVLALIHYIVEHQEVVEANWQAFEAEVAKGYSSEVAAKLDASALKMQKLRQEMLRRQGKEMGSVERPIDGRARDGSNAIPVKATAPG